VAGVGGIVAAGFNLGGLIMVILGVAGTAVGLRTLRPQVRDIEELLKPDRRPPGRWSNIMMGSGVLLGLVSLLLGIMLLLFGVAFLVLAP
jgi:hypothetical protein